MKQSFLVIFGSAFVLMGVTASWLWSAECPPNILIITSSTPKEQTAEVYNRVARQVRHWTQNDLLKPYGAKQTGTGIPRLYLEEPTLEIAAILLELSRYGATVEIMKSAADALYDDFENGGDSLFLATTDEGVAYLQVAWGESPETGKFTDAMAHLFEKSPWHENAEAHAGPSSSILINMSRALDRLYRVS